MKKETDLVTSENNAPRISVNLHRLAGDEVGYEASTRQLKNKHNLYFVTAAGGSEEALRQLADEIYEDGHGNVPDVIYRSFEIIYDECPKPAAKRLKDEKPTRYVLRTLIAWIAASANSPISQEEARDLMNMVRGDEEPKP